MPQRPNILILHILIAQLTQLPDLLDQGTLGLGLFWRFHVQLELRGLTAGYFMKGSAPASCLPWILLTGYFNLRFILVSGIAKIILKFPLLQF